MAESFAETLRSARVGEEWAIGVLWRDYQPSLLRYLQGRAGHAAEDVASETWIRVGRNLISFEGGEAEFRSWLFTIARRTLIDWQRNRSRRPATTVLADQHPAARRDDPSVQVVARLELDRALTLMQQLPADQADVILLRVVADLDTRRVAEILGKSTGSVRVLQHRGLRRLAELLQVDGTAERAAS
jgi:RNA polymerase sigma-70 factor (ECF subfamily)